MKIAIVHDWLIDWAGSERVLEQMCACYPTADLFSLVDFLEPEHRSKLQNRHATTTFLQRMPWSRSRLPYYLPLMPIAIEQLNLSAYDLIISSSHAVAKGIITGPDQVHISYVHSPMRYAWDLQHEYLRGPAGRGLTGLALRWTLHYLRSWDVRTANAVDAFIANSNFVAGRIRKFYGRDAHVIHPPIDVAAMTMREAKDDFYLCAGRLMPYKRVDLAVEAFRQMPDRKLIVIGDGPESQKLRRMASQNVVFIGHQPGNVLTDHLQRAKALVFPGTEDFGIVPLEAQSCGTPVIAFGKGGALETVRSLGSANPTGLLFQEQSVPALISAIDKFEQSRSFFRADQCRQNAERFSSEHFRQQFSKFVDTHLARRPLQTPRAVA